MINRKKTIAVTGITALSALLMTAPVYADETDGAAAQAGSTVTVTASALFVRQQPTTSSLILGTLPEGTEMEIEGSEDGWYSVEYNGMQGYISGDWVVVNDESGDAASTSADASDDQQDQDTDNTSEAQTSGTTLSDADRKLLASIIFCEAGGESATGKTAVGAVIMNRVRSGSFPNTIHDVIYQSGQFTPAMNGWLGQVLAGDVDASCYAAADAAAAGQDPTNGCLYFHAGGGSGLTIGNQTFY